MINELELGQVKLLQSLETAELAALSKYLHKQEVKKNGLITLQTEESSSLMFISSGRVRVSLSTTEGKEIILAYLEQGDFFGEIALLTGEKRSADVSALEDTTLLVLSKADFDRHTKEYSGLITNIAIALAKRLADSSGKIGDLALLDVYNRVIRQLKALASETEINHEKVWSISKRPTHQELAAMIGTSREMVSRALKELESEGVIEKDGKQLIIR